MEITFKDLKTRLAKIIKQNHKYEPQKIEDSTVNLSAIPTEDINFRNFVDNYCERWSISEDDFFIFNKILGLNNSKILEIGRFFGLSSAAFCCNKNVSLTSIDDNNCECHSFSILNFFNVYEFLNEEKYYKYNIRDIVIDNKLVDSISRQFLSMYDINFIDDKFSAKYLDNDYDFIFEDIVDDEDSFWVLDLLFKYLETHKKSVLIIHDDLRFPIVHNYIKNRNYCYDSAYFKLKYVIEPNLALISKTKINFPENLDCL